MSQITVYLDEDTQALLERAAKAAGVSRSRFVGDLIRRHAGRNWAQSCLDLAGHFADFPLRDDAVEAGTGSDLPRVTL